MISTNRWYKQDDEHRMQASREELVERLARIGHHGGSAELLPGLTLHRAYAPSGLVHGVSFPSLCLIAQGSKEIMLGDKRYRYNPGHYLISTVALPISTWITEASEEHPYLGLVLKLDPILVGSVLVEVGQVALRHHAGVTAIDVSSVDADLLDAAVRLVRLVDSSTDARFLTQPILREIVYRLLRGAQDERLYQIAGLGGNTHRIAEALEWIRNDFAQALRFEQLASDLGMSISSFNHHFRALTAMSPLQFQKLLRLQEARRLMLSEGLDAARAGYRVGYTNASHFTREYKRLFGEPPIRDVEQMREGTHGRVVQGTM